MNSNQTIWIPVPGDQKNNYLPGMQWVNDDLLLIQQLNRHQNKLSIWSYQPSSKTLKNIYTEEEETWVDLGYPDNILVSFTIHSFGFIIFSFSSNKL